MPIKKKDNTVLNSLIFVLGTKCKAELKDVVKLLEELKIHTKRDAIRTIEMLGSSGKKSNIKALKRIETHKEHVVSIGHPSVRFNNKRGIKHNYFIRGTVYTTSKYSKTISGTVNHYDNTYHIVATLNRTII